MVNCAECGLLALVRSGNHALEEAHSTFRETGGVSVPGLGTRVYERYPICSVRRCDLEAEYRDGQEVFTNNDGSDSAKAVIQKARDCEFFIPWRMGFTPQQHRELLDMQMDREWREQRLQEDRAWRDEQARLEREWRTEEAKDRRKSNLYLLLGVIVAAFVPIVAIILGNLLIPPPAPTIIVQPSEAALPAINVQPPEVRLVVCHS
jgi:hypothetical protein